MSNANGGDWPPSIEAINDLPDAEKDAIYRELLPDWIFERYGIARDTLTVDGQRVVHFRCPAGARGMELTIYHAPGAPAGPAHVPEHGG
jgi:hypothetical protein